MWREAGNVVLVRNCLVPAAASGAAFGGPRAGPRGGRGCEIAACGKLTFLNSSQLLLPEFLQHFVAFLVHLIPPVLFQWWGRASLANPTEPSGIPCASLRCPHIPEHVQRAQLAGGSGCHWFDSGRIHPTSAGVVFPSCR